MSETVTLTREDDILVAIEVDDFGRVYEVRRNGIMRDADGHVVVKGVKHRRPIEPDADVSKESAVIQAAAVEARTPAALARFEAVKSSER